MPVPLLSVAVLDWGKVAASATKRYWPFSAQSGPRDQLKDGRSGRAVAFRRTAARASVLYVGCVPAQVTHATHAPGEVMLILWLGRLQHLHGASDKLDGPGGPTRR